MGAASEFLGELIAFITSYLRANFVFGMSILQIWFVPVLLGIALSMILGRAKVYRNTTSTKESKKEG